MQTQSITIVGLIVMLLVFLFQATGVEIAQDKVQNFVEVAIQIIGLLTAWYGRMRKGDITILGRKK